LTSWIEDRSPIAEQTESPHYKSNPSILKKVYFANRCSSDARSDGKTIENDLSKAGIAEVTFPY
jgi:hypothetical protein